MAANFINTPDTTAQFDPQDIELNNRLSLLSNQGLVLLIAGIVSDLALLVLKLIAGALRSGLTALLYRIGRSGILIAMSAVLGGVVSAVFWILSVLISVALIVLAVLGIVNAVKGRARELPLIGRFHILHNH